MLIIKTIYCTYYRLRYESASVSVIEAALCSWDILTGVCTAPTCVPDDAFWTTRRKDTNTTGRTALGIFRMIEMADSTLKVLFRCDGLNNTGTFSFLFPRAINPRMNTIVKSHNCWDNFPLLATAVSIGKWFPTFYLLKTQSKILNLLLLLFRLQRFPKWLFLAASHPPSTNLQLQNRAVVWNLTI